MKILMLVPYLPTITMSGGQTRWYNIIRYLAKKHEITLFSLIKDESERKFIPELKKYCKEVKVFPRPKKPWTVRNILLSVFGPYPLLVIRNQSLEEKEAISEELASEKYDLIHAETFYVMPHLGKTNVPTILVEQTIWHDVYRHYVDREVPLILRPFYLQDVFKIKYWEKYYWGKADRLFGVSEEDREAMRKLVPDKDVGIIPNGVDTDFYDSKKMRKKSPPRVLYGVTNFEWLQNQEASEILIKKVWPLIKKKYPKVILWIAGRKIPSWINEKAKVSSDLVVTENIADARDAYLGASVMVAPIKGSGGTRLKILEAMAAGLPVVSTNTGVAGLRVKNGTNVLIADTERGLAEKTVRLLKDPRYAKKIGDAGKKHVKKYFDWKSVVKLHDPVYRDLVRKQEE
jgi:glycosyltransferase involved in cell wall biosynthesis